MLKMLKVWVFITSLMLPLACGAQIPMEQSQAEVAAAIPADTKLMQEAVWMDYKLKLLMNPSQPYLRGPVDFYIQGQHNLLKNPFPGSISIAFERISPLGLPLQETMIAQEDYIQEGLAKISHPFMEPGKYSVVVSFTLPAGEFFALRGEVPIAEEGFWVDHQKTILISSSALLILIFVLACWKKNKKN